MLIETNNGFVHSEDIIKLYKLDERNIVFFKTKYDQEMITCESREQTLLKFNEIHKSIT